MDPLSLLALLSISLFASTLSSIAGFGGSLIVLPVLVHLLGPLDAVPAFTIAGLMSNAARAWLGRTVIDRSIVRDYLVGAVPGAVLGSLLFVSLSPEWVQRGLAIFIIGMMFLHARASTHRWSWISLASAGGGSAFLSGIFGFSGPVSAAIFFAQGLSPAAYIASEAFAAMSVHAVKIVAYGKLDALNGGSLGTGLIVGATMSVGAWIGRRWIDRIPADRYRWMVRALFVLTAASLLVA